MNEKNRANYYAIIPAKVRYDKNLKPAEKDTLWRINST